MRRARRLIACRAALVALAGQIYLGQVLTSDHDAGDKFDSRNLVEVVVNRV